ncbi:MULTISPECIES: DNA polymerase IV [unclassified Polynucleobacter]|uniref:DNA polymerase Y family protein n=1 Tax=unclassified Polynucleobacter TaxID=2640945 RepID=UPI0008D85100|nr:MULTISPECIES: DNA polymerase IV [unclassified Polynucleobacter]OHC10326.1 MAG: DNA polymerase IV [Polynucleobacter sp. GWA2_45_21]HBK44154.1 DNA polymerase IV [Polynucleobacter sp.]
MTDPKPSPPRRIAHLDMDAFFASVELLRYPQLKDLPVVIGGSGHATTEELFAKILQSEPEWDDFRPHKIPLRFFPRLSSYVGRGVITTATYAARQFGVGSAMGLMKAAKLCPEAILLPVDFERYRHYSRLMKETVAEIAPVIEDRGLDEVYIDFTNVPGVQRKGGHTLARVIQMTVLSNTGLTCSIGVAPNKLLAKMASDMHKPNGICVLQASDLESLIWPLPCRKINGIGPKADAKLAKHEIATIGQLASQDPIWLMQEFGKSYGAWLYESAHGRNEDPVSPRGEPVNMSRETTFEKDLHPKKDKETLGPILTQLCERLSQDLKAKGYLGKTIGIRVRYGNFQSITRDMTIDAPSNDPNIIRQTAGQCIKRIDLNRSLRLLGVRASNLQKLEGNKQPKEKGADKEAQGQLDLEGS